MTSRELHRHDETVPLELLEEKLSKNIYDAVCRSMLVEQEPTENRLHKEYFNYNDIEPLTDEEKIKLFECTGKNALISDFTTSKLRELFPSEKHNEDDFEYSRKKKNHN